RAPVGRSSSVKWIFGLLLILAGALFLLAAFVHFTDTLKIARRQPKAMTAAELAQTKDAESAPTWIAYTVAESKPTQLSVPRSRLGAGGNVQARCLLVRVEDKWLVATVPPGFEGDRLVGRLVPVDSSSSQALLEKIRKLEPKPVALLSFEFVAVEGSAG